MKKLFLLLFITAFTFSGKAQQQLMNHQVWDGLLQKHVSADGKVNYMGFMKDSALLYEYFLQLSENMPQENWSKNDKLAYWINTYNAYTIKLIIDNYPIKSIKDIKDPWDKQFFKIGDEWYSLNQVEHKILRKFGDPRIHFAINCASFSCPLLLNKAYTGSMIQETLEKQAYDFINDPIRNTITADEVSVSKIFSWFKKDFKVDGGDVKDYINRFAKIKIKDQPKKGYKKYDWSLNE
ncbi:DUF547 domain-containing protein [Aquimarina rhabdastrellae]